MYTTHFNIIKYNNLPTMSPHPSPYNSYKSWDSVGDTTTMLRAGQSEVWSMAGARVFYCLQNVQIGSGAHPASYSIGTGGFLIQR